jgi:type IV pilus assembly protein PilW
VRTVAAGVEDLHFEYGIDLTTSGDGAVDAYVVSNNNPRTTGTDGTALGGSMLPTSTPATATDAASGEDRWEDVMAVKVSVVVRDTSAYDGVAGVRTFTLGVSDNSGTVLTAAYPKTGTDKFRRKLSVTTVSAVNLAARREQ